MFKKMGNGFLMRSDYYEEGGTKPEFFGKITIGEEGDDNPFEAELGAWIKEKDGKKYFSIAVTVKEVDESGEGEQSKDTDGPDEKDVPF